MVYYNEFDVKKAAWLRELIKVGAIADGTVDERSIELVQPGDLDGFIQCHFFAGIGIWSYSLRLAGISDDEPVWTFSCPCQPFSAAGKKKGFADRRHLFPEQFRLIRERRPVLCFGEQVSSPDGLAWLDDVRDHMEGAAYTFGAVDLCAAGAGAPHIRNRTFFVAYLPSDGWREKRQNSRGIGARDGAQGVCSGLGSSREPVVMGDSNGSRSQGRRIGRDGASECAAGPTGLVGGLEYPEHSERRPKHEIDRDAHGRLGSGRTGDVGGLADTDGGLAGDRGIQRSGEHGLISPHSSPAGPVNGFWRESGWVLCRPERSGGDPSWRPVERIAQPMDDELAANLGFMRIAGAYVGYPLKEKGQARVGRLRGYGDGIVAEVAAGFIKTALEEIGQR